MSAPAITITVARREGAAVGGDRLPLADSGSAADRLRLGLVSGRVLDDRLGELLVGVVIDRALLEPGGGDLVAQRGRQTGNRRAVQDGNGDVAGLDRGAAALRLVVAVRPRAAGTVTAVVAAQPGDAVDGRAAEDEQADEGDRDEASAGAAVRGLRAPRRLLGCSPGPLAQALDVTCVRDIEGREHGEAGDRGEPRGSADVLDYLQQGFAAAPAPGASPRSLRRRAPRLRVASRGCP